MDYKTLLSLAEKKGKDSNNEFLIKKRPKEGQTSGPNKASIEAFKARKQKEEMEKQRERQRERDRLLALRSQNSKSMKKAKMMKTRTKDNDFSRIVLTEDQLEEQRRVEEKLKRKGTQDLTQNKKSRDDLEDKLIRNGIKNLKNNKTNNSLQQNGSKYDKKDNKNNNIENKAKARPPKPAMSYEQLLSLAAEKANSEKKSLTEELMSEVKEKKEMRPMTQKQKDRLKEEMYYKQKSHNRLGPRLPDQEKAKKNTREPKQDVNSKPKPSFDPNSKYGANKLIPKTVINREPQKQEIKTSDKSVKNVNNYNSDPIKKPTDPPINRPMNNSVRNCPPVRQDSRRIGQSSTTAQNKAQIFNKMNNRLNTKNKEYNERYESASKERQKTAANEYRPTMPTNKSINQRARPPSPTAMRRAPPMPRLPPIGSNYRREMYENVAEYMDEDYEEEEDDDMSDFIDDGPEEKPIEEDYSRAIREIFGYDKRKYRNIEDDDDIEEANFVQCMKEDARSARIGLMEDLEEERKEEEEQKQKALMKKRLKK